MTDYITMLANGQYLEAIYTMLQERTGDFGIVMIFAAIFSYLWLRSESMTIPVIMAFLFGGMIFSLVTVGVQAAIKWVAYIFVAMGIAAILYKLFKS